MRANRWLLVGLVASVAVNLALAGFVVGRLGMPGPAPAALDPTLGLFQMLRALPEARRETLSPLLEAHFRSLRGDLRSLRVAQHRINQSLAAEPFDRDALADSLTEFRTTLLDSQRANHELLVQMADAMTLQERRLLRQTMIRHGRGPHHREAPLPR